MRIDNPSVLGLLNLQANSSAELSGSFSGSFTGTLTGTATQATTASYVNFSSIEGFSTFSGSASDRLSDLETFSSSLDTVYATDTELGSVSSSIVSTVSTVSSSLAGRVTTNEADIATLEGKTLVSGSIQIDHDQTTNFVSDEHIDHSSVTLTAGDGLSGGGDITTNRSFAVDSTVVRTSDSQSIGGVKTFTDDNQFTGTQYFDNIAVSGTGSFAYIQSITGSAKIIGDAYIILNANSPAERYAGIKVIDSGSTDTGSLEYDSVNNHWFYESTTEGYASGLISGPRDTRGAITWPTNNTIVKGIGSNHVDDSNITDDGSTITLDTTLYVTSSRVGIGTDTPGTELDVTGDIAGQRLKVGAGHTLTGDCSTIAGGSGNVACGSVSFVGGGQWNRACGASTAVVGGFDNTAKGTNSFIGGGAVNTTNSDYSTIAGGDTNCATGNYSTVGGGCNNKTNGTQATIGGGGRNLATGQAATVAGGLGNCAGSLYATVGGGLENCVYSLYSTVAGGQLNKATSLYGSIGGGNCNEASLGATVAGGGTNKATGAYSVVGGGLSNIASGSYTAVLGGTANNITGYDHSFIIGSCITAAADFTTYVNNLDVSGSAIIDGNLGIGTANPQGQLQVSNVSLSSPSIPSAGSINEFTTLYLTNSSTAYGLLFGNLWTGTSWIQVQRTDGTATTYNLALQPNGGNVGIGTTSPSQKLDVNGNILATSISAGFVGISTSAGQYASFNSTNANGGYLTFQSSGTVHGDIGTAAQIVSGGSSSDFGVNARGSRNLILGTNNVERMRIDSSGNVGIGTTNASYKLTISGATIQATSDLLLGEAAFSVSGDYVGLKTTFQSGTNDYMILSGKSDGNTYISAKNGSDTKIRGGGNDSGNEITVYDSNITDRIDFNTTTAYFNGDVGIGTSNPSAKLDVSGTIRSYNAGGFVNDLDDFGTVNLGARLTTDSTFLGVINRYGYQAYAVNITDSSNSTSARGSIEHYTKTDGNWKMTLSLNDGNVGIGTTSPAAKLDVNGSIFPSINATYDLGSSTKRWNVVYTSDLSLKNDHGDWTIVEGEDELFLYNNKKGKVYKFNLTEVDPTDAPPKRS